MDLHELETELDWQENRESYLQTPGILRRLRDAAEWLLVLVMIGVVIATSFWIELGE